MLTVPVLFLLSAGSFTVDFTLRVPEPVVGCVAHYHSFAGPTEVETHFECYTPEGKVIHRIISGVQKT